MFKYIKTLNNNSHPTEMISVFSGNENENHYAVKAGSIVSVSYGEILPTYDNTMFKYLTLSSKNEGEAKYIKCIRLFPGMVLEADTDPDSDAELFFIGASFLSTVTPAQLPTRSFLPVSALNMVVLPLFGLPAKAILILFSSSRSLHIVSTLVY